MSLHPMIEIYFALFSVAHMMYASVTGFPLLAASHSFIIVLFVVPYPLSF